MALTLHKMTTPRPSLPVVSHLSTAPISESALEQRRGKEWTAAAHRATSNKLSSFSSRPLLHSGQMSTTRSITAPTFLAAADGGWQKFLSDLESDLAPDVRALWTRLRADLAWLAVPHAGVLPDGNFQLVWNEGRHHINIEVVGRGQAEWFYLDRETRETAGDEFLVRNPLPRALLGKLAHVASAT